MKQINKFKWADQRNVTFEIDDGDGVLDRYEANVNVWYIIEPPELNYPGISYVDEIYINTVSKNDVDIPFIKQNELPSEIEAEIIEQLEYEM